MSRYAKGWQWAATLLLGAAVFFFWRWRFPAALAFQEQLQLFLFDHDYLVDRLAQPGGVACYVAEFIVQFYNNVSAGAAILALLFMLLQRGTWRLMRAEGEWYPLSFLPALMMWVLMGDENVMLTALVALLMTMACMLWCPKGRKSRILWLLVVLPLLYWLVGPMAIIAAIYIPFRGSEDTGNSLAAKSLTALGAVVYLVAVMVASAYFLPYPLLRVALGLGYYRYVETLPYLLLAIGIVVLLLAFFGKRLPKLAGRRQTVAIVCEVALLVAMMCVALPQSFDRRKYDLIEYDFLVRTNQWDKIIGKSVRRQPDLPMSVCATNLALAMKGELGERCFDFYQNGTGGLLPGFVRNFATLHLTGEAYFQLGLVNTAQRFAFEAMEAIPNYNKSARAIKRLAETNLINGQYQVAAKYLRMLEKTVFYRKWARHTMQLLDNEEAINAHPLYGKLRRLRLSDDFLFSENEIDKICGQLFMHNSQNTLAMQYMLMYPILEGDIDKLMGYAQVVQGKVMYNPRACQEALAYAFMRHGQMPPQGVVNPNVARRLEEFVSIYKSAGKGSPQMEPFRNTVWYYLTAE